LGQEVFKGFREPSARPSCGRPVGGRGLPSLVSRVFQLLGILTRLRGCREAIGQLLCVPCGGERGQLFRAGNLGAADMDGEPTVVQEAGTSWGKIRTTGHETLDPGPSPFATARVVSRGFVTKGQSLMVVQQGVAHTAAVMRGSP